MRLLAKVSAIFDRTLDLLVFLACILFVFMMLSVDAEVIMRYFLHRPLIWVLEITEICLLYITLLGATWVLKREGHVKMDIVINRLRPRTQSLLGIISSIIVVVVFAVVAWYGAEVTWDHFLRGTYRGTIMEIPNAYVLVIIPVGSFLLFVQFLRRTYGYLRSWRAGTKGVDKPTI